MAELRLEEVTSGLQSPWTITIPPATVITLSGASGTGKSRLLRTVVDLDPDTGGDAWLDDMQRSQTAPNVWRQQVGYLPATNSWWEERACDHFPDFDTNQLTELGLKETQFKSPVSCLSTGELQRLAILRLLAREPRALLLDEPTANLDAHHTALVEQLIRSYQQQHDTPIIWVSHDPAQRLRVSNRYFIMTTDEIQETPMKKD